MGSIKLDVTFGPETNYRMESIRFEVVPFKSAYHAIFERPADGYELVNPKRKVMM